MLKQRIITAVIMAGIFLSAIAWLPVAGLAVLFGILVALGAWEWSSLAGWHHPIARVLYVLVVLFALVAVYVYCQLGAQPLRVQVQPLLGVACLWWAFALL
jgi:phosphatidate cytidylyltransferase